MLKWKKMLGPEEWSKVYVMIPTVWPVALNSPRLQLFERIIDADKIHTHIITSEFPRNLEECRDVVGRVVGDRSVGRLVFGTADTKAKMKVSLCRTSNISRFNISTPHFLIAGSCFVVTH